MHSVLLVVYIFHANSLGEIRLEVVKNYMHFNVVIHSHLEKVKSLILRQKEYLINLLRLCMVEAGCVMGGRV
jgi:hypothetical protein